MILMTLEGIGITFGDTAILQNVTQGIDEYDRIGVIGINGTGKSTLLAILAGERTRDRSFVVADSRSLGFRRIRLMTPEGPSLRMWCKILNRTGNLKRTRRLGSHAGKAGHRRFRVMRETLSGGQRKRAALAAVL